MGVGIVLVCLGAGLVFGLFFSNENSKLDNNITNVTNNSVNNTNLTNDSWKNVSYENTKNQNKPNNKRADDDIISAEEAKKRFKNGVALERNEFAGEPKHVKGVGWLFPIFDKKTKKFTGSIYLGRYGGGFWSGPRDYKGFKDAGKNIPVEKPSVSGAVKAVKESNLFKKGSEVVGKPKKISSLTWLVPIYDKKSNELVRNLKVQWISGEHNAYFVSPDRGF